MKRFSVQFFLPLLTAAILLGAPQESKALCCLFDWWGGGYGSSYSSYYAPTYSSYYAPAYSSYYAPAYSSYYGPSYYSASYWPTTSYYAAPAYGYGGSSGCCGQSSYSAPSCCSPCNSCATGCSSCGTGCSNCASGDCGLASSSDPAYGTGTGTGSSRQNPTFIEEEDRGTGSQYEGSPMNPVSPPNPMNPGNDDGFSPRKSDETTDPLDQQPFGNSNAGVTNSLQFKIPESVIDRRQPAPAHEQKSQPARRVNDVQAPAFPLENLDEKITSRSVTSRTRLVERRSWEQPAIAKNVTRDVSDVNLGWVPVPAPTQLVQK